MLLKNLCFQFYTLIHTQKHEILLVDVLHHGDHAEHAGDEAQAAAGEVEQVPAAQEGAQIPRLGLVAAVGDFVQAGVCVAHDDDGKGHNGDDEGAGRGVAAPDAAGAVRVVGRVAVRQHHGGGDLGH